MHISTYLQRLFLLILITQFLFGKLKTLYSNSSISLQKNNIMNKSPKNRRPGDKLPLSRYSSKSDASKECEYVK